MTYQDILNFIVIAEEGSLNKAAERTYIAQSGLSKLLKRLEREFSITLFWRKKGGSLELTDEGKVFLKMAQEMRDSYGRMEEGIAQLRSQGKNDIVLGMPIQFSNGVVTPLLEMLHQRAPEYMVNIQTRNTSSLETELLEGLLDIGVVSVDSGRPLRDGVHYEPFSAVGRTAVFLREGSPAAELAVTMEDLDLPVLRMRDLAGEPMVVNLPGSVTRERQDRLAEKAGVTLDVIALPDFRNRRAMVTSGRASMMGTLYPGRHDRDIQPYPGRPFYLHPEDGVTVQDHLICREGFQRDPRFQTILRCIKELCP